MLQVPLVILVQEVSKEKLAQMEQLVILDSKGQLVKRVILVLKV